MRPVLAADKVAGGVNPGNLTTQRQANSWSGGASSARRGAARGERGVLDGAGSQTTAAGPISALGAATCSRQTEGGAWDSDGYSLCKTSGGRIEGQAAHEQLSRDPCTVRCRDRSGGRGERRVTVLDAETLQ